jgi:hypothetical protein
MTVTLPLPRLIVRREIQPGAPEGMLAALNEMAVHLCNPYSGCPDGDDDCDRWETRSIFNKCNPAILLLRLTKWETGIGNRQIRTEASILFDFEWRIIVGGSNEDWNGAVMAAWRDTNPAPEWRDYQPHDVADFAHAGLR